MLFFAFLHSHKRVGEVDSILFLNLAQHVAVENVEHSIPACRKTSNAEGLYFEVGRSVFDFPFSKPLGILSSLFIPRRS